MFTDHSTNEISIHVVVASTLDEERNRIARRLEGLSTRFLGHAVLVKVTAESDLANADMIIATAHSADLGAALADRDDGSFCILNLGPSGLPGSWSVVASEAELSKEVMTQLNRGLDEGRFAHETRLDDPFTKEAMIMGARLEIMSHVQEYWGEANSEYNLAELPQDRPYYFALECAPSRERSFWSYATVGLSLMPQPSLPDVASCVELVAYSPVADQRVADALFAAATHVANAEPGDPALKPFDTLDMSGAELCHDFFVLAPVPEPDGFKEFPAESSLRFNLAVAGTEEPCSKVVFLQLVPVTKGELDKARTDPRSVLDSLGRTGARRADGWSKLAPRSRWRF